MHFPTLLAGAAATFAATTLASPTPTTLQPFQVENLALSAADQTISFHINDPNENISADCSARLAAAGTVYQCENDAKVAFAFSEDLGEMSVAVTFPQGTLDDSDAYYIANATASTGKSGDGFAGHIDLPVKSISGVA